MYIYFKYIINKRLRSKNIDPFFLTSLFVVNIFTETSKVLKVLTWFNIFSRIFFAPHLQTSPSFTKETSCPCLFLFIRFSLINVTEMTVKTYLGYEPCVNKKLQGHHKRVKKSNHLVWCLNRVKLLILHTTIFDMERVLLQPANKVRK